MPMARVTVTLPAELVEHMDRMGKNRSRFILEAVRGEIKRRRREELRRSLRNPHPETRKLAEVGLREWSRRLPAEDADALVDLKSGTPIRWTPAEGWVEADE